MNVVSESPAHASVVHTYRLFSFNLFHSSTRATALALVALTHLTVSQQKPGAGTPHPPALAVKLVRGLLQARTHGGAWRTTMDNAWACQAIAAYAAAFEAAPAAYVARVWLGHQPVAAIPFAGFSRDTQVCKMGIPRLVTAGQKGMVVVQRQGPVDQGTLYVRMQLRTVSRGLSFEQLDHGIVVQRSYCPPRSGAEDDHDELRRHPHDDRVLCLRARAIVPGLYMVPPAVAEEMYAPEVYGRSAAAMLLLQ